MLWISLSLLNKLTKLLQHSEKKCKAEDDQEFDYSHVPGACTLPVPSFAGLLTRTVVAKAKLPLKLLDDIEATSSEPQVNDIDELSAWVRVSEVIREELGALGQVFEEYRSIHSVVHNYFLSNQREFRRAPTLPP